MDAHSPASGSTTYCPLCIQCLLDTHLPHVSTDVPITLSTFTTSNDRRHVRSFDNASALGAFGEEDSEPVPDQVDDEDENPAPADADTYEYDSLCRDCVSLCDFHIPRLSRDSILPPSVCAC